MDCEERKEMSLQDAENVIKHSNFALGVGTRNGAVAAAFVKIINAMKAENYQLIRLELLLEKINELAKNSLKRGDEGAVYIQCLEDVADIIKDCL